MKVVIVARNFDAGSRAAIKKLKQAGYEIEECKDHEFGVGAGEEELYERIKDAEVVIAGLEPYTEHLLSRCPKLKLISRRGIGYDSVDTAACRKFGITLARTTGEVEAAKRSQRGQMPWICMCSIIADIRNRSGKGFMAQVTDRWRSCWQKVTTYLPIFL